MKRYDFLANVQKHIDTKEEEVKKHEIGKIISSLQRPFTDVITSVHQDKRDKVHELYKLLGWKK